MGNFITFTPQPVTIQVTGKNDAYQPLWTVIDVSGFDILDLELGVLFLSAKVTADIFIETSMQNQSGDNWQIAGQFPQRINGAPNAVPNPQWQKLNIASGQTSQGLLKFVRWRVRLSGAGTVTFFIRGIARRWGR